MLAIMRTCSRNGSVAEWFKAAVLKTVEDVSPPRVRISALPPMNTIKVALTLSGLFYSDTKQSTEAWLSGLRQRS